MLLLLVVVHSLHSRTDIGSAVHSAGRDRSSPAVFMYRGSRWRRSFMCVRRRWVSPPTWRRRTAGDDTPAARSTRGGKMEFSISIQVHVRTGWWMSISFARMWWLLLLRVVVMVMMRRWMSSS